MLGLHPRHGSTPGAVSTKMVPSDPRIAVHSPPGALALNDAGKRNWRSPSSCLPLLLLEAAGFDCRRLSARLSRPELAFRNDLSLSPNERPSPGGHKEVMVPEPASSTPRGICFRSVRPAAPSLMPVCPGAGNIDTACPLPDTSPSIPVSHRIATPF